MDAELVRVEAPLPTRQGPSIGLSAGLATGFGPTFGIPIGRVLAMQIPLLPVFLPENGAGGSYGVRLQQFVGRNPRARLYLTEGGSMSGWDGTWLWGAGVGAGLEVCKDPSIGRREWVDLDVTAFGTDRPIAVLPLPEIGVSWVF